MANNKNLTQIIDRMSHETSWFDPVTGKKIIRCDPPWYTWARSGNGTGSQNNSPDAQDAKPIGAVGARPSLAELVQSEINDYNKFYGLPPISEISNPATAEKAALFIELKSYVEEQMARGSFILETPLYLSIQEGYARFRASGEFNDANLSRARRLGTDIGRSLAYLVCAREVAAKDSSLDDSYYDVITKGIDMLTAQYNALLGFIHKGIRELVARKLGITSNDVNLINIQGGTRPEKVFTKYKYVI